MRRRSMIGRRRPRPARRPLIASGDLRMSDNLPRWELEWVLAPILERLRACEHPHAGRESVDDWDREASPPIACQVKDLRGEATSTATVDKRRHE